MLVGSDSKRVYSPRPTWASLVVQLACQQSLATGNVATCNPYCTSTGVTGCSCNAVTGEQPVKSLHETRTCGMVQDFKYWPFGAVLLLAACSVESRMSCQCSTCINCTVHSCVSPVMLVCEARCQVRQCHKSDIFATNKCINCVFHSKLRNFTNLQLKTTLHASISNACDSIAQPHDEDLPRLSLHCNTHKTHITACHHTTQTIIIIQCYQSQMLTS